MAELDQSQLQADDGVSIPRLRNSELGITGLRKTNGYIYEDANRAFQRPTLFKIVQEMMADQTVASCLLAYQALIGRVKWDVSISPDSSEQEKERAKFIKSCMGDMTHSWSSFITEVLSYLPYGFAVQEKVFRRRLRSNGSKYNDGLIGWKKLPPRSQTTIYKWLFDETGRNLTGVEQDLSNIGTVQSGILLSKLGSTITIPREKFLLFTCSSTKENPEGNSILKNAYTAWKKLDLLDNQLMIGIARDLGGIPKITLPAKYMDPNASDADKAVYNAFKDIIAGLSTGAQSGVILPSATDPDSKKNVFDLELLESKGGKAYPVSDIIKDYQSSIRNSLLCGTLGFTGNVANAWSVTEGGTDILSLHLSFRLQEIADVLNDDLIRQTYELNGWETDNLPYFTYSDFDEISLEEFSKYIQRVTAVGLVEKDREVLNVVRRRMGVSEKSLDEPIDETMIAGGDSRSGDSFSTATGGLRGTSDSVPIEDESTRNLDNAA